MTEDGALESEQSPRPRVGISTCLLGERVRHDGGHKLDHFLTDTLGQFVDWVPVCPEVECGLPTPREAMRLVGDREDPRLVTSRTGEDMTDRMTEWASRRLSELEDEDLSGFVFKSGSPSSGMERVRVYDANGVPSKIGSGIFAAAFMKRFPLLPVEDDGRLHDPGLRENFIERVFCLARYRSFRKAESSLGGLVEFHARHKFQIMAHSRKHLTQMGRLVARGKEVPLPKLLREYEGQLLDALRLKATVRKNADVLMHMLGYFKKLLTADEKQEMLELIESYRSELVPLVVPVVLMQHYVRKYEEPYLMRQTYLNPHPDELKLRNHA